jgi:hypothetical protein
MPYLMQLCWIYITKKEMRIIRDKGRNWEPRRYSLTNAVSHWCVPKILDPGRRRMGECYIRLYSKSAKQPAYADSQFEPH